MTTATLSPPIHNGWYASPTLTLSADDGSGSGINHISYSIDGGPFQTYTGPVSGFTTGNHFVQYYATDNAGNIEAIKLIAFKADSDKPTANITRPADGASYKLGKVVNANYKCADKASGSGLDTCVGTVPVDSPIDTSTRRRSQLHGDGDRQGRQPDGEDRPLQRPLRLQRLLRPGLELGRRASTWCTRAT